VLPGPEGDQGLRLRRGDPNQAGTVEVVLNRSRRSGLPLEGCDGVVVWPEALAGDRDLGALQPQSAVVYVY
jgi:hypothetical protein